MAVYILGPSSSGKTTIMKRREVSFLRFCHAAFPLISLDKLRAMHDKVGRR